jgi:L-fuconolactonase
VTTDPNWLAQVDEAPIETEIPIIDPHHHLMHRPPDVKYILEDIVADTAGNNVRQTVFIQASGMQNPNETSPFRFVNETKWVEAIAVQSASGYWGPTRVATGIVGHAPLSLGDDVAPILEAHLAASPSRFRGIRDSTWFTEPPVRDQSRQRAGMLQDPKYRRGFELLHKYGLSYEAWLFHPQIAELTAFARDYPDHTIILNHLAGPLGVGAWEGKRDEVWAAWAPAITELATCQNVVVKVGGLGMGYLNGLGFEKRPKPPTSDEMLEVTGPWYSHIIEAFGPSRCMFESNFPPDKSSSSYTVLWNSFKKLTKSYSASERADMFHDVAMRTYRLERI